MFQVTERDGETVVTFQGQVVARTREELDAVVLQLTQQRRELAGDSAAPLALSIAALVVTFLLGPPTMGMGGLSPRSRRSTGRGGARGVGGYDMKLLMWFAMVIVMAAVGACSFPDEGDMVKAMLMDPIGLNSDRGHRIVAVAELKSRGAYKQVSIVECRHAAPTEYTVDEATGDLVPVKWQQWGTATPWEQAGKLIASTLIKCIQQDNYLRSYLECLNTLENALLTEAHEWMVKQGFPPAGNSLDPWGSESWKASIEGMKLIDPYYGYLWECREEVEDEYDPETFPGADEDKPIQPSKLTCLSELLQGDFPLIPVSPGFAPVLCPLATGDGCPNAPDHVFGNDRGDESGTTGGDQ